MRNMRVIAAFIVGLFLAFPMLAQMTPEQKLEDFRQLVALYDKDYAFYEWKRDALGFDLLKAQPWLDQISKTTDDLGYYELAQQYVASLQDGHDQYLNPSDFSADLQFGVDLYDGKVLVDAVYLPSSQYDIAIGDELVSIDGKTTEQIIADYSKYSSDATPRPKRRDAVGFASFRPEAINPRAAFVGDSASVLLRGADGNLKTLTIPWLKTGTLFTNIGPVPGLTGTVSVRRSVANDRRRPPHRPMPVTTATSSERQKLYRSLTMRFQHMRKPGLIRPNSYLGLGGLAPIFRHALPAGFSQRLGYSGDVFYSGTFQAGNHTIGFIRIPDFEAGSGASTIIDLEFGVNQFQNEIAYMNEHTDGLIVDVTSNPGGFGFYALQLLDRLTTQTYSQAGFAVRPEYADVVGLNQAIDNARSLSLEQWQIDLLTAYRDEIRTAYESNRGMTGPLPIDFGWSLDPADLSSLSFDHPPILNDAGQPAGYAKPVVLLANDSSFSAAELFAAAFQDMQRGPVVGFPTGGLGGGRMDSLTGVYSEASTSVTVTRLLRTHSITNPDVPAAPFIENIGVRPDMTLDYMTADNLTTGGSAYVDSFTKALLTLLPAGSPSH